MPDGIGYLLPSGDVSEDELECAIVFYPKRDEYRRALLGSLTYLATWRAWERDADKRGKDAASSWRLALEQTLGCWNMNCIQELITNQEWMIEWMATHSLDCCEGTTYGDTTIIITIITPFIGDPPDFYGETAVSDWDDWAAHVCFNANAWVDLLIENALVLEEGLLAGGVGMGMLAYALAAIAFIGTGGLLAIPVIMLGAASLLAIEGSGTFSDAADDLEAAREDIVCALIYGLDVATVIEDALSSGLAWDTVFSRLNYDTPTAIIHEGGGLDNYLPADTSDACNCEQPIELHGWTIENNDLVETADWIAPPGCKLNNDSGWTDFKKPAGPNHWGDLTIRGVIKISGGMDEFADCEDEGSLWVRLSVCKMDDSSGYNHVCTPTWTYIFNQVGGVDGLFDMEIPYEFTAEVNNVFTLSLNFWAQWRFGSLLVEMTNEVHFFEIA